MKHPKRPPPVVEVKKRRSPAPPTAQPKPYNPRKVWHADAPKPQPPPKPPSWYEYLERQIEIACWRIRGVNDQAVADDAAEAMALRDEFRREAASIIAVRDNVSGEAFKITPKNRRGPLARVLEMLGGNAVLFIGSRPDDMRAPRSVREAIKRLKD